MVKSKDTPMLCSLNNPLLQSTKGLMCDFTVTPNQLKSLSATKKNQRVKSVLKGVPSCCAIDVDETSYGALMECLRKSVALPELQRVTLWSVRGCVV